jgi:UDP-N-acetyl-D-mannosaminuronic acid dehydrogenase
MRNFTNLCVVGLGYIGLPTAVVFADRGVQVNGADVNPQAVDSINRGEPHIVEPGLDSLLRQVVESGKLRATKRPCPADAFILAVPTPFRDDHQPDLGYIRDACASLAPCLVKGNLVILESTSPLGATEQVSHWLAEARPDLTFPHQAGEEADVNVAHCPERVLPGAILREVVDNDRVIGGMTPACARAAENLYRIIVKGDIHLTDARTAEMAKLTENAFRDVNIAFANELSMVCDQQGINVWELIRLANLHPRVSILNPGPGVGGHCIAVDPWFIIAANPAETRLMQAARWVNDNKPHYVVEQIAGCASGLAKPVIACLGLAYKPDVDDLRESPAVEVCCMLATRQLGEVLAVEPYVDALPSRLVDLGVRMAGLDEALERADVVVLLVDHAQFRKVDQGRLAGKRVVDTRGTWRNAR